MRHGNIARIARNALQFFDFSKSIIAISGFGDQFLNLSIPSNPRNIFGGATVEEKVSEIAPRNP